MPLAPLIEPYASDPDMLLALCIWREARGESLDAKIGVRSVIANRCAMAPAQGFKHDVAANILHPWAFSSFMEGDPNASKYPIESDPSWAQSQIAASPQADNTMGAVFYFSRPLTEPPKAWGAVEHSATIGGLQFYRIKA
jgi:spore germination cell wall hydrolase CwlJ-like protein